MYTMVASRLSGSEMDELLGNIETLELEKNRRNVVGGALLEKKEKYSLPVKILIIIVPLTVNTDVYGRRKPEVSYK